MKDFDVTVRLLRLSEAARYIDFKRAKFHRLVRQGFMVPPVMTRPCNHWNTDHLERFAAGLIKKNHDGVWIQLNADGEWHPLPNQYDSDSEAA